MAFSLAGTVSFPTSSYAKSKYAAFVMDAKTGRVLFSRNANVLRYPASLTKMMTLYLVFEALESGRLSLSQKLVASRRATGVSPSKLGLKKGETISVESVILALVTKSANDAATAIGEAISGSEAAFARRMTRTAKALGMSRTTFKNAHGLTESGHLSTARDMTNLGRHMLYDYPQYYNLFSRTTTNAGVKMVNNTNRRLLAAYRGADGIKTGYTRAAGFNLVASAQRGNERIIATVFGGKSSASRNAKVAELLDLGFRRAPSRAPIRKPAAPNYAGVPELAAPKTIVVASAVKKSLRPKARPTAVLVAVATTAAGDQTKLQAGISAAVAEAAVAEVTAPKAVETSSATPSTKSSQRPASRPANLVLAKVEVPIKPEPQQEIVTRLSTSGGRQWGINVGRFNTRYQAEKVLLRTALAEMSTLDGSLRKVVQSNRGFDANFMGMTQETADLACRRLQARNVSCSPIGPSS